MQLLGEDFHKMPKAVIAAIAVSLALRIDGDNFDLVKGSISKEWKMLYANGIVSQKPITT